MSENLKCWQYGIQVGMSEFNDLIRKMPEASSLIIEIVPYLKPWIGAKAVEERAKALLADATPPCT